MKRTLLLLTIILCASATVLSQNLLTNGSFENFTANPDGTITNFVDFGTFNAWAVPAWARPNIRLSDQSPQNGAKSIYFKDGGAGPMKQKVALTVGKKYLVSAWVKWSEGAVNTGDCTLKVDALGGNNSGGLTFMEVKLTGMQTAWTEYSFEFTAHVNGPNHEIVVQRFAGGGIEPIGDMHVDNVVLTEVDVYIDPGDGVYNTSHESIASYDVPAWYSEGKLGVFMHLSAFSVPAFKNEWYARNMYYAEDVSAMNDPNNPVVAEYHKSFRDHHVATYGPRNVFGYKDFIPMLKLEKFDADYYADLVKRSGATYFAAPAVHHDGFAMWDSEVIDWNAAKMGPKRDVVGELTEAMRRQGIKTGVSTHYGRHWAYYIFRPEFDTWDPAYEGIYGKRRSDNDPPRPEDALKWESAMNELIENYQPDYIFVDGGIADGLNSYGKPYHRDAMYRVVANYYNKSVEWNKNVVLSWKRNSMQKGEGVYDTEGTLEEGIPERPWQAHFTINDKWAYAGERPATPMGPILRCFVDLISKNANVLLNIGPRPDGTLEKTQEDVLLQIGEWMAVNGEGITGTKPWTTYGSGKLNSIAGGKDWNDYDDDAIRYTQKDANLYAWFVKWPNNGKLRLPKAGDFNPTTIKPLGDTENLSFVKEANDLIVDLPDVQFGEHVWGLKISTNTNSAESVLGENLSFYPNPCKDILRINNAVGIKTASIANLAGQVILKQEINSSNDQSIINTSTLEKGVYLLQVTGKQGETQTVKLIKH